MPFMPAENSTSTTSSAWMQAVQLALSTKKLSQAGFVLHAKGDFLHLFDLQSVLRLTLGMAAEPILNAYPRPPPLLFALHHTNHSWISTDLLLFSTAFVAQYWQRLPIDDSFPQLVSF